MDQIKIGKFITQCRKEQGFTQLQLADKLNITDKAISKWETGKGLPDSSIMLYRLLKLCVRKDERKTEYFRHCVYTFLCALPALFYILLQFLAYFFWGGSYGADGSFWAPQIS